MTPRAITVRLAEPRDAQAIAMMSRDFIEAGLGWKYDAARVLRAIRDRDTLAVVACEGGKSGAPAGAARGALAGFADRKSTRLNSSHGYISYAVFCLKKK